MYGVGTGEEQVPPPSLRSAVGMTRLDGEGAGMAGFYVWSGYGRKAGSSAFASLSRRNDKVRWGGRRNGRVCVWRAGGRKAGSSGFALLSRRNDKVEWGGRRNGKGFMYGVGTGEKQVPPASLCSAVGMTRLDGEGAGMAGFVYGERGGRKAGSSAFASLSRRNDKVEWGGRRNDKGFVFNHSITNRSMTQFPRLVCRGRSRPAR